MKKYTFATYINEFNGLTYHEAVLEAGGETPRSPIVRLRYVHEDKSWYRLVSVSAFTFAQTGVPECQGFYLDNLSVQQAWKQFKALCALLDIKGV